MLQCCILKHKPESVSKPVTHSHEAAPLQAGGAHRHPHRSGTTCSMMASGVLPRILMALAATAALWLCIGWAL
jgi:hypothetical protein